MLRIQLLRRSLTSTGVCKSYLTNEFKEVMGAPHMQESNLQSLGTGREVNFAEVYFFAQRLTSNEDRHRDVLEKLLKLRQRNDATSLVESTSYAVVKHFLDTENTQPLITMLQNRLHYGIFIDKFTGTYLMNHLLERREYVAAAQIAVELTLQEDFESNLVVALSSLSYYKYLKNLLNEPADTTDFVTPITEKKEKAVEKKIRVKYLRNSSNDMNINEMHLIGKSVLKLTDKCTTDIKMDMKIIGYLLCNQYTEMIDVLNSNSYVFDKEILGICQDMLKNKVGVPEGLLDSLNSKMETDLRSQAFHDKLEILVKEAVQQEGPTFIQEQKIKYDKWINEREMNIKKELHVRSNASRLTNIQNIVSEIDIKKQQLQFFKLEDKIDLDIYRKRTVYPKRWFGKKKTPKIVDDGYIPPEIITKK